MLVSTSSVLAPLEIHRVVRVGGISFCGLTTAWLEGKSEVSVSFMQNKQKSATRSSTMLLDAGALATKHVDVGKDPVESAVALHVGA